MMTERAIPYRRDLDGLRAIAVAAVVIYHYFPRLLPGGFAGVDVFFVLSGYLISGIIQDGLRARDFTLENFYRHRVRRILPALAVVLAFVLAAGWILFLPDEYARLGKEVASGSFFVSNLYYWYLAHAGGGYFDARVQYSPLLHLWSLGVEEQFYFAWPIVMMFLMRRRRNPAAAIAIFSFFPSQAVFISPTAILWRVFIPRLHGYGKSC